MQSRVVHRSKWTLIASLVATLLACGDGNPASSKSVTLTVANGLLLWDIYTIQVSPEGSSNWGADRLASTEILPPGRTKQIDLTSGVYDLRASDEDGDCYYDIGRNIKNDYTWQVTLSALDDGCSYGKPVAVALGHQEKSRQ